MDRYQKVEKPKTETAISENELRITAQGRLRNYISYAISLLEVFIYLFIYSFGTLYPVCTFFILACTLPVFR